MTAAITVRDLVKRFPRSSGYRHLLPWSRRGEVTALAGLSLDVAEGELLGLLGPNGAGKTTLMKILATLILPTSGRASVYGADIVSASAEARRLVGLISSDERSFYWRLTGRQNLEFFASIYQLPRRLAGHRVAALLSQVGLADAADERFQTYSTGMRQKMAVARGLLTDPRLLLVDEPTRSLDPLSAQTVRAMLKAEVACGRTVVLATHMMSEAEQLCDRVAIIDRGRILACGSVGSLRLGRGRERCRLEISGLADYHYASLRQSPGVTSLDVLSEQSGLAEIEVNLDDSRMGLARLIEAVVRLGGRIHACNTRELSLDEIFVDVVSGNTAETDPRSADERVPAGSAGRR